MVKYSLSINDFRAANPHGPTNDFWDRLGGYPLRGVKSMYLSRLPEQEKWSFKGVKWNRRYRETDLKENKGLNW